MKKLFWNILISLDQFGNTITGGNPDETISSRAGKAAEQGKLWAIALCKFLHIIDKGHCAKSIERDEK